MFVADILIKLTIKHYIVICITCAWPFYTHVIWSEVIYKSTFFFFLWKILHCCKKIVHFLLQILLQNEFVPFTKWSSRVVFGCWCCGAKLEILWCREWWWKHRSFPPFLIIICLMLCLICNYFSLQFPYCREAKSKDFFQGWLKRYEVFSNVMIPMSFAWISCPSHTKYGPHPNYM